jgi:hypothetical protein
MTNLQRWQYYTRFLFSPQVYIDFSWRYIVAAALQRRVWYGSITGDPLFPNPYIVFIGDAGVGKGLVLGKATEFLKYHTYSNENPVDKIASRKFLFPPGPDDLTYEKLCEKLAHSTQWFKHTNGDGTRVAYSHASMSFVLEELGSLFVRRHDDRLNKLFLKCYDCKDHDYETRHQGDHQVRKTCMSLLAGCTPEFLPKALRQGILEDGTVSRMIFIYEWEPRSNEFFLGQPGDRELECKKALLDHLKVLSGLYGEVTLASGVHEFLENWYKTEWKEKARRCHPKMRTYFSRSRVHILKLAMACHFSDNLDMVLTREDFQMALDMLESIEPHMTLCLSAAGRNENNRLTKDILEYIASAPDGFVTLPDLLTQYQTELNFEGLRTIIEDLRIMGKLQEHEGKYTAL